MPWCDGCDRFMNPNTLRADGACPKCGRKVAEPTAAGAGRPSATASPAAARPDEAVPKAPWHFKLLVVLTVVYLAWRLVQLFTGLV